MTIIKPQQNTRKRELCVYNSCDVHYVLIRWKWILYWFFAFILVSIITQVLPIIFLSNDFTMKYIFDH